MSLVADTLFPGGGGKILAIFRNDMKKNE